jgi:hypothetical protein
MEHSPNWEADSSSENEKLSCHWTRRFITAFTRAYQVPLSWTRSTHSNPHTISWKFFLILSSNQTTGLPRGLFSLFFPSKTLYGSLLSTTMCHIPYTSPFPSFGNLSNIIWITHIINRRTNQHLPLVFPVCSLPGTTCKYHVRCATGSKLPLAISTQSVVPAVDVTDVCHSIFPVICKMIDYFDKSSDMWAM